jgi:hypothetical protein
LLLEVLADAAQTDFGCAWSLVSAGERWRRHDRSEMGHRRSQLRTGCDLKNLGGFSISKSDRSYFRMASMPRRRFLVFVTDPEYLVKSASGGVSRMGLRELRAALDVAPGDSRRDWQECEMVAARLFRDGELEKWVEYPTGFIISDSELLE